MITPLNSRPMAADWSDMAPVVMPWPMRCCSARSDHLEHAGLADQVADPWVVEPTAGRGRSRLTMAAPSPLWLWLGGWVT